MLMTAGAADVPAVPPEMSQYPDGWPLPNHDYNNSRAVATSAINSGNVDSLGIAWSMPIEGIGSYGGSASTPLILGETVYFQDLMSNVYALDLVTGTIKWTKMYNDSNYGPNGPAVGWSKVFVNKGHYNVSALNLSTGEEIWATRLSYVNTTGIDIQPQIYGGKVFISTVPGTADINWYTPGGIGILYALDQETGAIKWALSGVDSPETWGHPEINAGGGAWMSPAMRGGYGPGTTRPIATAATIRRRGMRSTSGITARSAWAT